MKGLYLHIPFCRSKCPYCDFYSCLTDERAADKYCTALLDEIKTGRRAAPFTERADFSFDTVYFGGGTPSVFGAARIAGVCSAIREAYTLAPDAEITVECNPSTVSDSFFQTVSSQGVNRISFGLQSAVDRERRALGRTADRETVQKAIESAQKSGISNLSLDVMLGIPYQTIASLDETLDFCLAMEVPHISAYMLTMEENTVFFRRRNTLNLPDEDTVCELYLHMAEKLERHGIRQYEISNFAKPGLESRHNLKYWNCEEYLGLGPSAHSFIGGKRFFFERDTEAFLNGQQAVWDACGGEENEYLMLRLRLADGIVFDDYQKRFGAPLPDTLLKKARLFQKQGFLVIEDTKLFLTKKGFLLSNAIIRELLQ